MERILSFALWLAAMAVGVQACDWTGSFSSSFGPLLFQQQGDVLIGDDVAQHGVFAGRVNACDLEGVFLNERSGQFGPVIFRLDTTGAPGAGKPNARINPHCNVSPLAWPMQAAEFLEDRFPNKVFKLTNFACSGTIIAGDGDLIKIQRQGVDEYGQKWLNGRFAQLSHLNAAIQRHGRNPDFIFVSAGINNGDFQGVITVAADKGLFSLEGKAELTNRALHISQLRDRYDALHGQLRNLVSDASRIVLIAYPDSTRNRTGKEVGCERKLFRDASAQSLAGTQCDMTIFPHKYGPWNAGFDKLAAIPGKDWKLANSAFAQPIFDQQEFAALRHGWTFIANTAALFRGRGICAPDSVREMNQPCDAIRRQGQLQGGFHPNAKGHSRVGSLAARIIGDRFF